MNLTGVVILACVVIAFYMYRKVKRFPIMMMEQHLLNRDYQKAIDALNSASIVKVMSAFEKDQKILKIYFMWGKKALFIEQLNKMVETNYPKHQKQKVDLFIHWFHNFLAYDAGEFAQLFLDAINKVDEKEAQFCKLCYDVLIAKQDHLETLMSHNQQYKLVDLKSAMYLYLIAMSLDQKQERKQAAAYFNHALIQFETLRIYFYYDKAKKYIETYGDSSLLYYAKKSENKQQYRFTSEDFKNMYQFGKKKR